MAAFFWILLSFMLSPAGFFWLHARDPDWISLVIASCAFSSAVIGIVFSRISRRHHIQAAVAFALATFLLLTNMYFLFMFR